MPAVHVPQAELVTQALPEVKRSYFTHWVDKVAAGLGIRAELFDKNLPLMEKR